jgi:hypothetical protein
VTRASRPDRIAFVGGRPLAVRRDDVLRRYRAVVDEPGVYAGASGVVCRWVVEKFVVLVECAVRKVVAHRGPYALRHTYASFSIAAGVSLFELARFMGISVEQIDRTYGHVCRTRSTAAAGRVWTRSSIVGYGRAYRRPMPTSPESAWLTSRGAEIRTRDLQFANLAQGR